MQRTVTMILHLAGAQWQVGSRLTPALIGRGVASAEFLQRVGAHLPQPRDNLKIWYCECTEVSAIMRHVLHRGCNRMR